MGLSSARAAMQTTRELSELSRASAEAIEKIGVS